MGQTCSARLTEQVVLMLLLIGYIVPARVGAHVQVSSSLL